MQAGLDGVEKKTNLDVEVAALDPGVVGAHEHRGIRITISRLECGRGAVDPAAPLRVNLAHLFRHQVGAQRDVSDEIEHELNVVAGAGKVRGDERGGELADVVLGVGVGRRGC